MKEEFFTSRNEQRCGNEFGKCVLELFGECSRGCSYYLGKGKRTRKLYDQLWRPLAKHGGGLEIETFERSVRDDKTGC